VSNDARLVVLLLRNKHAVNGKLLSSPDCPHVSTRLICVFLFSNIVRRSFRPDVLIRSIIDDERCSISFDHVKVFVQCREQIMKKQQLTKYHRVRYLNAGFCKFRAYIINDNVRILFYIGQHSNSTFFAFTGIRTYFLDR